MKSLRLIPCALALLVGTLAYSQESVGDVLDIVRANSPALKVAGGTLEMEKLQNRAERLPENPEFEFENVWAEGPDDGFGREIRVRQGLDFATVSGMRGKMAASLDGLSELRYQAEVVEVMAQAKELCARIVFCNLMIDALTEYESILDDLYQTTLRKSELGEATVLDEGKARIQLSQIRARLSRTRMDRASLLASLRTLAGKEDLDFNGRVFPEYATGMGFEAWLAEAELSNPLLRMMEQEIARTELQLKMDRSAWVPELNLGYLYEAGRNERSRGLTLGISVPLWSNASRVKSSVAAVNVAREQRLRQESEFRALVRDAWDQAVGFREIAAESRACLVESDNRPLLRKALDSGEMSLLDFLLETGLYYDALESTLSAELDYHLAMCGLQRYGGMD